MEVLDMINIACTIASVVGAYKSVAYYKKSRQLIIYTKTNVAYLETIKIISTFSEMLKLANNIKRGINCEKEVRKNGESIKNSINKIREDLPVKSSRKINELLNDTKKQAEKYIDSLIIGTVVIDGKLIIDEKFYKSQETFYEIQLFLKQQLENIESKVK